VGSTEAESGSAVTIRGDAFELNGAGINDLSMGLPGVANSEILTGVLAVGRVFISPSDDYRFAPGTTTLQTVSVAPSTNSGVLSSGTFAQGVRAGETVIVTRTGTLADNFSVVGGTLNMEGGVADGCFSVAFGEVSVSGGVVSLLET